MDLDGVRWRKSSRSSGSAEDTNCVEVIVWRKSSWSSGQDEENSNCVEVALVDTDVWQESGRSGGSVEDINCVEVAIRRKSSQGDLGRENRVVVAMIDEASSPLSSTSTFAAIRDSKNPGSALLLPHTAWSGLVRRLDS